MSEMQPFAVLQETKFMVIDEDSRAAYAEDFIGGYVQMLKDSQSSRINCHQVHLLLFIGPHTFHNYLLGIIGKDNLKIHDYFTSDVYDLSEHREINLDYISIDSNIDDKSIVIINCLSSLIFTVGLAKAVKYVEKLASRVGQLICIFNRDMYVEKFPNIETLGTTYIQLNRCKTTVINSDIAYEISIRHRKKGGGIWKKTFMIIQSIESHKMKMEKIKPIIIPKVNIFAAESAIKPEATFRTEINARELEQRNKTPLPYIINSDGSNESRIIYSPDDLDDFDDEDPDDDLPF